MSGGRACRNRSHEWVVVTRRGNYSAFSGYHFTRSAYSEVRCLDCGSRWRTKAAYVAALKDLNWMAAEEEHCRRAYVQRVDGVFIRKSVQTPSAAS